MKFTVPLLTNVFEPSVLNRGRAVYGIRNLLLYGIDCKAIAWYRAAEKCTFDDAIRLWRLHTKPAAYEILAKA